MNALAKVPASALAFDEIERLAVNIAKSGLFGIKTPDQAVALMMIAHAEGRHPALAARDYDVIQGRPAKKAEAMMRDFMEAGGKVEWHALTDDVADATFSHQQGGSVRITWDMKRAQAAGLGGKDNWKKFPRQMLRSRAVSEGVRTIWPMATSGMYVPEEARDHPGPTIDHDDAESPPVAPIRAAASEMQRPPTVRASTEEQRPRTRRAFLDGLAISFRDAQTHEEVDRIICGDEVARARKEFTNGHKDELERLIAETTKKWWPEETDGADTANEPETTGA